MDERESKSHLVFLQLNRRAGTFFPIQPFGVG